VTERRSTHQVDADVATVMLGELARLDEVEIFEFLRVARDFPTYFPPAS
jgi:hypothetical protein